MYKQTELMGYLHLATSRTLLLEWSLVLCNTAVVVCPAVTCSHDVHLHNQQCTLCGL